MSGISFLSMQSVQHRANGDGELHFEVDPLYVQPASQEWQLGPADLSFEGRATVVQLALFLTTPIDTGRFATALQRALDIFACAGGQPSSGHIASGCGVRFSAIRLSESELAARPPPASLFDSLEAPSTAAAAGRSVRTTDGPTSRMSDVSAAPAATSAPERRSSLLTIRVANSDCSAGVGCSFDHRLCDVAGAALLLAHVSAAYTGEAPPISPVHNRLEQSRLRLQAALPARDLGQPPVEQGGAASGAASGAVATALRVRRARLSLT